MLPGDIFFVSYVRSGSTWTRFLVGNLIHQNQAVNFANVSRLVPSIYEFPDRVLRSLPRVMKSHECFDPRYPQVIHLVRDPRDIAVSFYHYSLKMRIFPNAFPIEDFVERFLNANVVSYADRLGSWEDHTASWLRMRQGHPGYCLIRYEDLLADPHAKLQELAVILGIDANAERIERAVHLSSASEMRSLEKKQWKQWSATKGSRQDIPFVREAKAGGWQKQLSPALARKIEDAWGPLMDTLGYERNVSRSLESPMEKPYATR